MSNKRWINLATILLVDLLVINFSFLAAFYVYFGLFDFSRLVLGYSQQIIFINVLWLVILNLAGLYKLQKVAFFGVENVISISFGVLSAAFFNYIIVVYLYPEAGYSKEIVIIGSVFILILVNVGRFLVAKHYIK